MTVRTDTLWEQVLKPIVSNLIDKEEISQNQKNIDWETAVDRIANPNLEYPDYYRSQNFHGIAGGYLTSSAAVTYDPITRYFVPPHETWVREDAIKLIKGKPQRILDLGCGTGSTTVLLQQTFPHAEVIGLDLSPYMLIMAQQKAEKKQLPIQWCHGKAEDTGLDTETFDLVTASLLFHETPVTISKAILRESFRLLKGGGELVILDGNQDTLRASEWLTNIFEEPYIQEYARGDVETWLKGVGFVVTETHPIWGIHQVNLGRKPQPVGTTSPVMVQEEENEDIAVTVPA